MPATEKRSMTYEIIYEVVQQIPKGKVATYGEIATLAGMQGKPRVIGYALHALPWGSKIPWQRVINSEGKISLSNVDGMYDEQKRLLRKEGVQFVKERVDFSKFGWLQTTNQRSHDYLRQKSQWRKRTTR